MLKFVVHIQAYVRKSREFLVNYKDSGYKKAFKYLLTRLQDEEKVF